jgi:hypothetical protein
MYQRILRTEVWMERSHWEKWIKEGQYGLQALYLILHTLSTNCVHGDSYFASQTKETRSGTLPVYINY